MKKTAAFLSLLMLLLMLGGCKLVRIEEGERTSLKYTVVDHSQIPEQAAKLIEEKKEKEIPWFLAFCKAADSSDTSGNRRAGVLLFWRVCQSGQCHA